jgi:hypothetical protein
MFMKPYCYNISIIDVFIYIQHKIVNVEPDEYHEPVARQLPLRQDVDNDSQQAGKMTSSLLQYAD